MADRIVIDRYNLVSLSLEVYSASNRFTGTGFIVEKQNRNFLITNWHMVTGRSTISRQPLSPTGFADPDKLFVWFNAKDKIGDWIMKEITLIDSDGNKKWHEHNDNRNFDVVAIEIPSFDDVNFYHMDLNLANTDLIVSPSEDVSIIGFPFGLTAGGKFPIWKTGNVASEIQIDFDSLPIFLIDATTKSGMSGSPVIAKRIGMARFSNGFQMGGETIRFLGIYSGRIHNDSDIGLVWKPKVIEEILATI